MSCDDMSIGATLDLLASPLTHERAARIRDHRPWPAPPRTWVMAQTWTDLLFAHWSVPASALAGAEADIDVNTMTTEIALDAGDAPLLHYASRQDVVFWNLQPVGADPERARTLRF